jgi:hypothetical protein
MMKQQASHHKMKMTATELNTLHASILEEGDNIITDDKNLSFQLSILSSKQIADNTWWESLLEKESKWQTTTPAHYVFKADDR